LHPLPVRRPPTPPSPLGKNDRDGFSHRLESCECQSQGCIIGGINPIWSPNDGKENSPGRIGPPRR
jgi:hypothetical protein